MNTSPSVLAEIMWQAAVAVGHHARSTPLSAIQEGCVRAFGDKSKESYDAYSDARKVYVICMGTAWHPGHFHVDGMWLSKLGRDQMVTAFLFCYEFVVTEMSGDRVTIPDYVTVCNANQTAVHPESVVV